MRGTRKQADQDDLAPEFGIEGAVGDRGLIPGKLLEDLEARPPGAWIGGSEYVAQGLL